MIFPLPPNRASSLFPLLFRRLSVPHVLYIKQVLSFHYLNPLVALTLEFDSITVSLSFQRI